MSEKENKLEGMIEDQQKRLENHLRDLMRMKFVYEYFDEVYLKILQQSFIIDKLCKIIVEKEILEEDTVQKIISESSEYAMKNYSSVLSNVTHDIVKKYKDVLHECKEEGCEHSNDI